MDAKERDGMMEKWDYYSGHIKAGTAGSLPRDWFENLLDCFDEEIEKYKYIAWSFYMIHSEFKVSIDFNNGNVHNGYDEGDVIGSEWYREIMEKCRKEFI